MSKPDTNVINLRPDAATIAPDRPCWAVVFTWWGIARAVSRWRN